ncbi:hypothetical protein ACIGFK_24870 [Streptomyces sp. NPDC085524]|uniref:hypothetical protein n=1 Tax=Streptomyces sp. NPDC085524 TaxID=3365728 RepID=UPI0037D54083
MGNRRGTTGRRTTDAWSGIAPGAETVGGAALLCAAFYAQLAALAGEPYGRGYGGGIAVLFWLFVMCVIGPFIALGLGYVHSLLFTTPVMAASNLAGVRTRVSAPYWAAPTAALIAAGYAVPLSLLADASYAAAFGWIAAVGAPPVVVAVFARMRQVPRGTVRRRAVAPIAVAVVATFFIGVDVPAYQPPVLGRADYIGEWAGDHVRLELGPQGEAVVRRLPVHDGFEVVSHCSGRGTWKPVEQAYGDRAGVALAVPGCERAELTWQVAGTAQRPELFVLMGDPDDGETAVLRKQAG